MANNNIQKIPVYKRSGSFLTPKQKLLREKSFRVLINIRNSKKSLSKVSSEYNISVNTVLHNTNAFKKVNGRWIAKKYDKIPRVMKINEKGKEVSFEIMDSRIASSIGKYHNAVKEFLYTGNSSKLSKFRYRKIKNAQGNYHKFETDLQSIIYINQRREEPEFYEGVYAP